MRVSKILPQYARGVLEDGRKFALRIQTSVHIGVPAREWNDDVLHEHVQSFVDDLSLEMRRRRRVPEHGGDRFADVFVRGAAQQLNQGRNTVAVLQFELE